MRIPAETFPPGEFIEDEMKYRGWTLDDLHRRLGDDPITCCCVDLCMAVHDKNLLMDERTAEALGRAFGTSSDYWMNLDRAWRGVQ